MNCSPRTAVLIFADSQQRDLRRRGLSSRHAPLLSLPRLQELSGRADLHWFTDAAARSNPVAQRHGVTVHKQRGQTFGERLENAVEELTRDGYEQVVVVGRDCPQLSADDVASAIDQLDTHRLILGPDHRGGCYLIAFHTVDRARLCGIRWQQNTDAAELAGRFEQADILLLEIRYDLDTIADLRLLARVLPLAKLLLSVVRSRSRQLAVLVRNTLFILRSLQLPPPPFPVVRVGA